MKKTIHHQSKEIQEQITFSINLEKAVLGLCGATIRAAIERLIKYRAVKEREQGKWHH